MNPRLPLVGPRTLILVLTAVLSGCGPATPPVAELPPPPVTVSQALGRTVTDEEEFEGHIVARPKVEVRARVEGHLVKVKVHEGEMVKKNDLLFEIDPALYQADLDAAKAEEKAGNAELKFAVAEYKRTVTLVSKKAASGEDLERWTAKQAIAHASVLRARAAIDKAQINLDFTKIKAPFDGKVGRVQVDQGNVVSPGGGGTLLTTLVAVDPMYVDFTIDERFLIRYRASQKKKVKADAKQAVLPDLPVGPPAPPGKKAKPKEEWISLRDRRIPLLVALQGEEGYPHKGLLDSADNQVNPSTGTILLRGILKNPDQIYDDGMAARVLAPVSEPYRAVLITERAIGSDQGRRFVYVVDADNVARARDVTPGRHFGRLLAIEEGLKAGEWVVVNGIQRVRDGMKVKPQRAPMPGAETPAEPAR